MRPLSVLLREAIGLLHREGEPEAAAPVVDVLTRCRVRTDPEVATAWIKREGEGLELRIGTHFADRWLGSALNAAFVCGHEASHFIEGHMDIPDLPGMPRAFMAWALEIPTNAQVMRAFLPGGAPLLAALYPLDRLEACMLRPPADLIAHLAQQGLEPGPFRGLDHRQICALLDARPRHRDRLAALLQEQLEGLPGVERPREVAALYVEGWTRSQEPVDWLMQCHDAVGREVHAGRWCEVPLLGEHHRPPGPGSRRWMSRLDRAYQRHRQAEEQELELALAEPPGLLQRRFLEAVQPALAPWMPRASSGEGRHEPTLIPHPGRRELILRAAGVQPLTSLVRRPVPAPARTRVHLYPDVSMSMMDAHQWYPALASLLGDALMEPIWAWSGFVRPVSLAELLGGRLRTDGWTCIEPVVHHAIAHKHQRLLVITDGEFLVEEELPATVRDAGLEIVFLVIGDERVQAQEGLRAIATQIVTFTP